MLPRSIPLTGPCKIAYATHTSIQSFWLGVVYLTLQVTDLESYTGRNLAEFSRCGFDAYWKKLLLQSMMRTWLAYSLLRPTYFVGLIPEKERKSLLKCDWS